MGETGDSSTPTTTESQVHATGEMMEIIDKSERIDSVLVNDTYTYKTGKYNQSKGTAVAYIETGQSSDSGDQLYRVEMNVDIENVTSVKKVDSVNLTTSK